MIKFDNVSKVYIQGKNALQKITFHVKTGEMIYLTGHSGAGKTTILRLITAQEKTSLGRIFFNNNSITEISKQEIPFLRRKIGVIFQDHHLMMNKTVAENIALPLFIQGYDKDYISKNVHEVIKKVKLQGKGDVYPIHLSTGEQQRVGIARAIVAKPLVLLADEPTGNLDKALSHEIIEVFNELNAEGMTIIVATHDIDLINTYPRRTVRLQSGNVIYDGEFNLEDYVNNA
jgi:cell division transport system ATP-binding protein